MSRPLKFRAYDTERGKRIVTEISAVGRGNFLELTGHTSNVELVQYTGKKDKNGVEIYEGDIVKYRYMTEGRSVVRYSDYYASFEPFSQLRHSVWETIEVIGNEYENPELLDPQQGKE